MTTSTAHYPGDVVNGYVLQANGTWVPIEEPSSTVKKAEPRTSINKVAVACVAGGIVLVVIILALIGTSASASTSASSVSKVSDSTQADRATSTRALSAIKQEMDSMSADARSSDSMDYALVASEIKGFRTIANIAEGLSFQNDATATRYAHDVTQKADLISGALMYEDYRAASDGLAEIRSTISAWTSYNDSKS